MTDVRKIRFRFIAVLLSVLLIVSLFVPVLGTVKTTQVDAAGSTITFYFDTGGGSPGGSYGWSKGMSQVVYYCSNDPDSNDHGATELLFKSSDAKTAKMTLTSIKSKKDSVNGKVFKATVSSEYAGKYLTFSPFYDDSGVYQQKGYYRTACRDPIKVRDNIVVYLSNTEQDGYWQSWYYDLSKEELDDFTGQTFKIANLTEASESFTFKYKNSAGVVVKTITGQNVPARNLGTQFTIPAVENEGDEPFAGVEIVRESDNKTIKDYTFSSDPKLEKLRGKTLKYGITQYAEETPKYADDADFKTVSFSDEDYGTYPAVSDKYLYFANKGFKDDMVHTYTNIVVKIGNTTYPVEAVTTNGNAAYVTTRKISVSDNQVFSVYCTYGDKTDIYNLVWNDSSKNLCVLGSGDVAQVTDEYSVQSTNNVLNGQNYMTVRADFFDYQYDTMNGSKYTYDLFSDATNHSVQTIDSQLGNAKRPYLAVNEAISASAYGNTSVPMYLGQFWLPTDGSGIYFTNSTDAYNNTTAAKQKAGNNSYYQHNERYYASDQTYGNHPNFGFGNNLNNFKWGANLAFRTTDQDSGTYRPFDAVAQGLVDNYLDGSTETSYTPGGKLKSGNVAVPYFDKSWWTGDFYTSQNNTKINKADYLNLYENLDFPFFEIQSDEIKFQNGYTKDTLLSDTTDTYSGTYYVFDSKEYSIKVEQEGGKTSLKKSNYLHLNPTASDKYKDMVFDNYGNNGENNATDNGQLLGFFPFNSSSNTNKSNGYEDASLHYGYGIRYDIDFYMTETGTVDGRPDGTAITFTFQGDDDVWVFLDGRLLLDMGGAHKNALGEINFKTKKTWISAIGQANTNNIISDNQYNSELDDSCITRSRVNVTKSFSDWGNRLTEGEHTITMFYMERGMLNSNLYCMFNLPTDITKLQIQNDTDFGKVNSAFLAATQYVADNDVFNYAIENKDTDQNLGSTYKALTGSDIFRNNTAGYMATQLAAGSSVTSKTETITDLNSFYLNLASFSNWKGYSAKFGIIMLNDSGGAKFQMFTDTSDDNIKKVSRDNNYNKFVILRLLPSTYETKTYSSDGWNSVINYLKSVNGIDDGYWNRAPNRPDSKSFESNRNCYKITDWNSGNWDSNYTQTVTNTNQHTYNFNYGATADSDGFIPMISKSGGVTYEVRDYMAKSGDTVLPVVYDSRQYNWAGDSNIVSLQYGELASFSKQFQANSRMRVTQLDSLSGVNSGSRVTDAGYNDSAGRTVSKYYSTYVKSQGNEDSLQKLPSAGIYKGNDVSGIKLADVTTMYEQESSGDYVLNDALASKNYSNNTVINLQRNKTGENVVTNYSFSDPEKPTSTNVFLRQVFVNAVNTVDLKIAKYMTGETSDQDFTFTLTFSNVFGSDDDTANSRIDVSALQYYLNDSTTPKPFTTHNNSAKSVTFTLQPNQYITIKGIPVGTKYMIDETADAAFVLDADSSTNIGYVNGVLTATELTEDTDVSWFNKRKTGAIRMRKLLYDADGTTKITTNTDDFEFVVNCTAPTGVAIGSYPIKYHTSGAPTAVNSLIWNKTETSPGVYQYSIVVNVKPEAVENNQDVIIEGIPVGTAYTVSENIKGAYAQLGEVEYTKGTSDTKDKEVEKLYTGSSMDDKIDLIKISNKIVPIIMPTTGGSGVVFIVPFGILAIVLSGAALMIYKKKTENGYNKGKGRYMK